MDVADQLIYGALTGDATLVALCTDGVRTGQISNGHPKPGVDPDYLYFIEEAGTDDYTWKRRAAIDLDYMVKAVAVSSASLAAVEKAKAIRERADAILTDNLTFSAAGYRIGRRRRYGVFGYEEDDGGKRYYHAGFRYRIRLIPL